MSSKFDYIDSNENRKFNIQNSGKKQKSLLLSFWKFRSQSYTVGSLKKYLLDSKYTTFKKT